MVGRFLPLAILALIALLVGWRLAAPAPSGITSQLSGRPVPEMTLPPALDGKPGIDALATGEARLVNLFGSWCNPCIAEAPLLEQLAGRGIPIDGIAVRDEPAALRDFLDRHGDPFARIGDDPDSQAVLALGATGVPETFLIDAQGIVRLHHQGPIEPADAQRIAAEWEALR